MFDKTIGTRVHGSNFVIFNFHENDDYFWNSVESLEYLIAYYLMIFLNIK